eukprot:CAMPEP_0119305474 /NCGR_PEP_ID=MMETSP1333-20130426/6476_1 /TAXON_ID=418940 /ORGANISM="Scyphosphaera apsteinii, Strain RCC1455" /LENGTH=350 /DNA_ID=CAMNT_0007308573 /DNA_START=78 /DNA_END=1130 /DNA_ORIENTATION=-
MSQLRFVLFLAAIASSRNAPIRLHEQPPIKQLKLPQMKQVVPIKQLGLPLTKLEHERHKVELAHERQNIKQNTLVCTPSVTFRGAVASRSDLSVASDGSVSVKDSSGTSTAFIISNFGSSPTGAQISQVRDGIGVPSIVTFDICYKNTALGSGMDDSTAASRDIQKDIFEANVAIKMQVHSMLEVYLPCENAACSRRSDIASLLTVVTPAAISADVKYRSNANTNHLRRSGSDTFECDLGKEEGGDGRHNRRKEGCPDATITLMDEIKVPPLGRFCLGTLVVNVTQISPSAFRSGTFYSNVRSRDMSGSTLEGPALPFAIDDERCEQTDLQANAKGTMEVTLHRPGKTEL